MGKEKQSVQTGEGLASNRAGIFFINNITVSIKPRNQYNNGVLKVSQWT